MSNLYRVSTLRVFKGMSRGFTSVSANENIFSLDWQRSPVNTTKIDMSSVALVSGSGSDTSKRNWAFERHSESKMMAVVLQVTLSHFRKW